MATDTRTLPSYLSSDADFRTWGQGIAAQLVAAGLVKTTDTGQIDLTTALKPTVIDTASGYEMYRFADALQSTSPIFVKVEYGVGGGVTRPSAYFTVGTGTNGAGALTGQISTRDGYGSSADRTAGELLNSYVSGSMSAGALGGRVTLFTNVLAAAGNTASLFHVERTRDGSGIATADGAIVWAGSARTKVSGNIRYAHQVLPFIAGVAVPAQFQSASTAWPGPQWVGGGGGVTGSIAAGVATGPMIESLGKTVFGCGLLYMSADLPGVAAVTVNHFGAAHTYLTQSQTLSNGGLYPGSNAGGNQSCMFPFE